MQGLARGRWNQRARTESAHLGLDGLRQSGSRCLACARICLTLSSTFLLLSLGLTWIPHPQRAIRTAMARKRSFYRTNLFTLFNRKEAWEPNDHLHGGLCGLPGSLPKIGSSYFKPLLKFFFTHTSSEFLARMRQSSRKVLQQESLGFQLSGNTHYR